MDPAPILEASPQIKIHLFAAIGAFMVGLTIFLNRKGTRFHRSLGWTYVALMTITAVSAVFIRRPEGAGWSLNGYTPIHLFVVLTAISLPMALIAIRSGNVHAHARAMIGLYIGAILIAGALTFLPGRIMHTAFFSG